MGKNTDEGTKSDELITVDAGRSHYTDFTSKNFHQSCHKQNRTKLTLSQPTLDPADYSSSSEGVSSSSVYSRWYYFAYCLPQNGLQRCHSAIS